MFGKIGVIYLKKIYKNIKLKELDFYVHAFKYYDIILF